MSKYVGIFYVQNTSQDCISIKDVNKLWNLPFGQYIEQDCFVG